MPLPPYAEVQLARLQRLLLGRAGFSVSFIFTPSPRESETCRDALSRWLAVRSDVTGCALEAVDPFTLERWRSALRMRVVTADPAAHAARRPLWLQLDHSALSAADADNLRAEALAALDDCLPLIEKTFGRPLLIALPTGFNPQVLRSAPNLWARRDFAGELPVLPVVRAEVPGWQGDFGWAQGGNKSAPAPAARKPLQALETLPEVQEWRRLALFAQERPGDVAPQPVMAAAARAWEVGHGLAAQRYAEQAVQLTRARQRLADAGNALSRQREWAQALDALGEIALARGDLAAAALAFQESLTVHRSMVTRWNSPQAQRDLAFALLKVGKLAQAAEAWPEAKSACKESAEVFRTLSLQLGKLPEAQRDLSIALAQWGGVALLAGDMAEAERACRECLAIRSARARQTDSPHALHDVFEALTGMGQVVAALDRPTEALALFRESLAVCREGMARQGETADWLKSLADALRRLDQLEPAHGNTRSLLETEALLARLVALRPDVPRYRVRLDDIRRVLASARPVQSDTLAH